MNTIVVDLGYGDAGKGSVVDWLARTRPVHTVVRYNGGAQAAHNVITPDGRHHTFSQFGSASFVPGVRTHLSRFMLVEPIALAAEARHLGSVGVIDGLERLSASGDALVTTPFHRMANRAREIARGADRHGSCGVGVGETMRLSLDHPDAGALRVSDLGTPRAIDRLRSIRDLLVDELGSAVLDGVPRVDDLAALYRAFVSRVRVVDDASAIRRASHRGEIVFEGAQGVLLDEWRGFHPYTTWSTTTTDNALVLAAEAGLADVERLGVVRAYQTRHGAGPFVTEDPALAARLPEWHNETGNWQGAFRVGHLDLVALDYALQVTGGVDSLAVTHLDRIDAADARVCRHYVLGDGRLVTRLRPGPWQDLVHQERMTSMLLEAVPVLDAPAGPWDTLLERETGVPVIMRSYGPSALDKQASRDASRRVMMAS